VHAVRKAEIQETKWSSEKLCMEYCGFLLEGTSAGGICLALLLYETNIGTNLLIALIALGLVAKSLGPKPVLYHHILPFM